MSKFKVGDKVIVKSKSVPGQIAEYSYFIKITPAINGHWIVNRINGDGSGRDIDNCICVSNGINGHNGCFTPQDLELCEEPSSEPVEQLKQILSEEPEIERYVRCETINEWRMVLDRLFDEGKGWIGTTGRVYPDNYFDVGKRYVIVNGQDIRCYTESMLENTKCIVESASQWLSMYGVPREELKPPLLISSTPKIYPVFESYIELMKSISDYRDESILKVNKKPNKIKQMTNNIVEFAKNLTLSADEKLLREVGLHDDEGCYTEDALNIALNLESVEIGFKSYQDLCDSVPEGCQFSLLEAAKLLKKYEVQLLDIAKKLKEESKSNKK